jgi:co-chaperonin GroES (HSP10)
MAFSSELNQVNDTLTAELREAFPIIDPSVTPLGSRVLVQIRTPKTKTKGGIILTPESKDYEQWNTQIGRVLDVGPVAFRNRTTMELWPEGKWVQPGDFVRVPKHGGDKFEIPLPNTQGECALFVLFNDHDMIARIDGNPLDVKVYI